MAEERDQEWVEASPPVDQIFLFCAAIGGTFGLLLLLAPIYRDEPEGLAHYLVSTLGLCILLGLIPIYRRERHGILRWNDKEVQQLYQSHFRHSSLAYECKNLTTVKEPGPFGKWTTLKFGYGKSLSFRATIDIPLSDYYKVLNIAKRKLKENARTP
ncbi:MAG: hypothetical protein PVI41_12395 [Roseobacter sp.]|jgi:hypothetical protein